MDIRQVKAERPKLGDVAETRFKILHNHLNITKLEATVALLLGKVGPQLVSTKKTDYTISADGDRVHVEMRAAKNPEATNFMSFPEPIRLFCNEIGILHTNYMQFSQMLEDEIAQVVVDFNALATEGALRVEQGKHAIHIWRDGQKLHFHYPESQVSKSPLKPSEPICQTQEIFSTLSTP
jgi:hypothetical protein